MKIRFMQRVAAAIACLGMTVPQMALAEAPVAMAAPADIALSEGGVFAGQVVDAHGAPIANTDVTILQAGQEITRTTTDETGAFAASGLTGGQYDVVAGEGQVTYRLWAAETAPPAANRAALIVTGDQVVNGQCARACSSECGPGCPPSGGGGVLGWMRNHPFLVAGGVAAAIAIPLAVADDDDSAS